MDAVRLTPPTVLGTTQRTATRGGSRAETPSDVLLVVAQNGRKIAYHHPPSSADEKIVGIDQQVLADLLLPKAALFEQLFDLTVGEHRLIGWPVALPLSPILATERPLLRGADASHHHLHAGCGNGCCCSTSAAMTPSATPASPPPLPAAASSASSTVLIELSVVFILDAQPAAEEEARYDRALAGCKHAVDQLSHALQREEAYAGLVSLHTGGRASVSSRVGGGGAGGGGVENGGADAGSGLYAAGADGSSPCGGVSSSSAAGDRGGSSGETELATILRSALHALQEDRPIVLRVGACTDVALCAPPPPPPPPRLAPASGGMPPPPSLRPYLALMPLDDPTTIAESLPPDASPLLVRLIRAANPLRSLEELADETGIAMPRLFSLVGHLQLWGKVQVIHPLTSDSTLCVAGDAPAEPSDEVKALLADNAAAPPTYQEVLSLFTSAQRFGLVIRAAEALHLPKRDLVRMTIALLKSGALEQVHTYIHCVAPPPEPPEPLSPSAAADGHDGGPALARWRLFRRLWPLLHGEHHLEEIMWQERVSRDAIDDLLHAYSDHLVAVCTI